MNGFGIFLVTCGTFLYLQTRAEIRAEEKVSAITYKVPTQDVSLQAFSTFELQVLNYVKLESKLTVKYKLPRELDGIGQEVEFSGSIGSEPQVDLEGVNGLMKCDLSLEMCHVRYDDLRLDRRQLLLNLHQISSSTREFDQRLKVSRIFNGDPVGVIYLKYKNEPKTK